MTPEQLQQAQALIDALKSIPEKEWLGWDKNGVIVKKVHDDGQIAREHQPWTDIRKQLVCDAPTLLALLEMALETLQETTNIFRQASVAFAQENAELKARIKEFEKTHIMALADDFQKIAIENQNNIEQKLSELDAKDEL